MPANIKITQDFKKLEQFNKNLKTQLVTKVGILGETTSRDDGLTNAEVGAIHEFGSFTKNIPRRSFLNDPLIEKSKDLSSTAQRLINQNIVKQDGVRKVFEQIGIKAEQIIQLAFASSGFGKWPALNQKTIDKKGKSSILIDSAQLRKSITSKVEKAQQ